MLDIWMQSIARAGGIEVPENRHIIEPQLPPVAQPEPRKDGFVVKFMHWLRARLAPADRHGWPLTAPHSIKPEGCH